MTRYFPLVLLLVAPGLGQRLTFEVASVKPATDEQRMDVVPRRSGDLVMMHNTQPYSMIFYAYHLRAKYQLAGYVRPPDSAAWFDVDARAGQGATDDQVREMFQSLLEDRFKLKVHREKREIPVYELTLNKGKSKLTPAREGPLTLTIDEKSYTQPPGTCGTSVSRQGSDLVCHAATMETIVAEVGNILKAPVVDRTGLTGTFDLHLRFIEEGRRLEADLEPGPSLTQAIQEELGLKLEKTIGPVEVLVIDHMEKPAQN